MNTTIVQALSEFPRTWQSLWDETHVVRCMGCGRRRRHTTLYGITDALIRPCPKCRSANLNAYTTDGNLVSVRCGTGHGSTIATFGCRCLKPFLLGAESLTPPLYFPAGGDPVLCHECKCLLAKTGTWDDLIDRIGTYCLFCMAAVVREARRRNIPVNIVAEDRTR